MKTGERIEQERQALGMSQGELARRVTALGKDLSQGGVDKMEKRGTDRPHTLPEIAQVLGVTEEWLRTGKGPKRPGEVALADGHEFQEVWDRLTTPQRQRVTAFAEGMLADQPPPPAPQPPPAVPSNMVRTNFKEQPEIPTIHSGNRRPRPVHLAAWLDHLGWTPEDLAKRVDIPGAVPDAIPGLISGKYSYDQEWLYEIAQALGVSMEKLYEMPPPLPAKPAKKSRIKRTET